MEQINLNLIPDGVKPVCHTSQFDVGRQIRLNLFEGSSIYTLSGSELLVLDVKKEDTCVVTVEVANTSSDYVIITTTQQMTACPGENICELKITNGTTVIGTLNFIMEVEEDPLNNGVTSQSAIHDLTTQVEDIVSQLVGMSDFIFTLGGGPGSNILDLGLSFVTCEIS